MLLLYVCSICKINTINCLFSMFFHSDVCSPECCFSANFVSAKCPFDLVCVGHQSFCLLSFGLYSFRLNVFQPYVHSTKSLQAICPFSHMSFDHKSVRSFVSRPSVLSPSQAHNFLTCYQPDPKDDFSPKNYIFTLICPADSLTRSLELTRSVLKFYQLI